MNYGNNNNFQTIDQWAYNVIGIQDESKIFEKERTEYLQNKEILLGENVLVSAGPCTYCKSEKTRFVMLRTRGLDEPETQFRFCVNCGRKQRIQ